MTAVATPELKDLVLGEIAEGGRTGLSPGAPGLAGRDAQGVVGGTEGPNEERSGDGSAAPSTSPSRRMTRRLGPRVAGGR